MVKDYWLIMEFFKGGNPCHVLKYIKEGYSRTLDNLMEVHQVQSSAQKMLRNEELAHNVVYCLRAYILQLHGRYMTELEAITAFSPLSSNRSHIGPPADMQKLLQLLATRA